MQTAAVRAKCFTLPCGLAPQHLYVHTILQSIGLEKTVRVTEPFEYQGAGVLTVRSDP